MTTANTASASDDTTSFDGKRKIDDLLLDRLDAFRVLEADSHEERGKLLEEIGGAGKAEQDIVDQLSKIKPLWRPDRFEEAHRLAMRALEVIDRNGGRGASMPKYFGPLKPVVGFIVQLITRWIVRSHQNTLIDRVRKLYERREANSVWGSPEHVMLRRARINAVQIEEKLKSKAFGLPTFLLGGAFLSSIIGGIQAAARSAIENSTGVVIGTIVLLGVLFFLAWAALYAAAISRRRIRRATDQPITALWETIGAAGDPPRDQSYNFAIYAIIITVLAWIVIPLAIWLAIKAGDDDAAAAAVTIRRSIQALTGIGA